MPYDAAGTYTPPTGAENAAAGQIIRSATWNSVHTDLATALTEVRTTYDQSSPATLVTGNFTLGTQSSVIFNSSGTSTITLPAASSYPGRWLYTKTVANQAVVASATVVQPLVGPAGTVGVTILAATAGKFAQLQSNGTHWVIMAGN
jgi:hypothetical protein